MKSLARRICVLATAFFLLASPALSAAERIPEGVKTKRAAAELFFRAYKTKNVKLAAIIAADGPVDEIARRLGAGENPTLRLVDDTHIAYEGGSIEMLIAKNSAGQWYVKKLTATAD